MESPVAVAATTTAGSKRWIVIGIISLLMFGSTQQSAMLGQGMARIINLVSVERVIQDGPRSNSNIHNGTTAVGLSSSIENKTLTNNSSSNTTGLLSSSQPLPSQSSSQSSPATISISIPICTYKAYGSNKRIHQQPSKVEEVLDFLVARLHNKFNAPVALMYGTALHEYRSGISHNINHQTIQDDPSHVCLRPNVNDKDFDIALFQPHWHYIISKEFTEEIQSKFKWTIAYNAAMKKTTFATMYPNGQFKKAMQIDLYGFQCNNSTTTGGNGWSNDTILFPWDGVRIARDSFLPLRKHKSILLPDGYEQKIMYNHNINNSNNGTTADGNITNRNHNGNHNNNHDDDGDGHHHVPRYHMPYNPSCLLENIYGSDYMIPKSSGKSTQAKYRTKMGIPAHGNPDCNTYGSLWEEEKVELERQLAFCSVG